MTDTLDALRQTATDALRAALRSSGEARTNALRTVAEKYVAAREHFTTKTGDVDWAGRTYAYRQFVRDVTGAANVPAAERGTVQAAIRYHIGNALRDLLPADELAAHGLRSESPRERSIEKRETTSAIVNLLTGGAKLDNSTSITDASAAFTRALRRVDMDALTPEEKEASRAALLELAAEAVRRAG